ncbi:MAG: hypothetical protein FJ137_10935 [Deltaproteobacteria bacterium]|nr:hypothetical protein [Deltaproteobacteria bacterium]
MSGADGRRHDGADEAADGRRALLVIGVLAMASTLPFAWARFPVGQDLPAHVETAAQIRALWSGDIELARSYVLHGPPWPNALPTFLVALLLPIVDGLVAGKVVTAVGIVGWPLTLALLCRRLGRSPWAALLALPTCFDLSLSYGFLHFVVGKPLFALALVAAVDVARRPDRRRGATLALALTALFCTHLMLFVVGSGLVVAMLAILSRGARGRVVSAVAVVAGAAPAVGWWLLARPAATPGGATMFAPLPAALGALWSNLGDRHDDVMDVVPWLVCLLAAVVAAVVSDRACAAPRRENAALVVVFIGVAGFALFGPVRTPHVAIVAERFTAPAVALGALLVPVAGARARAVAVVAAVVATCVLVVDVGGRWRAFSATDMGNFDALLDRIPPGARVATHYVTPFSPHGRHNAAWHWPKLVALRGGSTDDSFAWRSTCVVGLQDGVRPPLQPRLVDGELAAWDFLLVRGRAASTDRALAALALTPVFATGTWRLFRVDDARVDDARVDDVRVDDARAAGELAPPSTGSASPVAGERPVAR